MPFVFSSLLLIVMNDYEVEIRIIGLLYASIILSFLGAVHWGHLLHLKENNNSLWLWGVSTSLLAWFSLIIIVIFKKLCQKVEKNCKVRDALGLLHADQAKRRLRRT